jgi:hypothetical protein
MCQGDCKPDKYLGVKIIQAVPMTAADAAVVLQRPIDTSNADEAGNGYLVEYPDGYRSWSPKKQFDEAYRRTDGLTFGLAVEAMNKGLKVRLPHWSTDVFISMQFPDEHSKMTHKYMYVTSRFGRIPWIPTQIEMLAENWQIVD